MNVHQIRYDLIRASSWINPHEYPATRVRSVAVVVAGPASRLHWRGPGRTSVVGEEKQH